MISLYIKVSKPNTKSYFGTLVQTFAGLLQKNYSVLLYCSHLMLEWHQSNASGTFLAFDFTNSFWCRKKQQNFLSFLLVIKPVLSFLLKTYFHLSYYRRKVSLSYWFFRGLSSLPPNIYYILYFFHFHFSCCTFHAVIII